MAGNAWTLPDDLSLAFAIYPSSPVIAVNGASAEVKAIALFSYHPQRFIVKGFEWIRKQRKIHPDFTVHGSKFIPDCPWVQHWWEDARGGGGSAWGARKLAWLLGFDPVILVGCPLSPGQYAGYKPGQIMTRKDVTEQYVQEISDDKDWHEGAYSMSGRTRDILGFV